MGSLRGGTTIGGFLATHYDNFRLMLKNLTNITLTGEVTGTAKFDADGNLSMATSLTAADVLAKIKTVDGSGSGLDADTVDGMNVVSGSPTASSIVARTSDGYIYANYYNSSRGEEGTAAASYIYDTGDGWMRKKSLANVRTEIMGVGSGTSFMRTDANTATTGSIDVSGGSGTAYNTAPIEILMGFPRIGFHIPGVVASQVGMNSSGEIVAYNNPGTGYTAFRAAAIYTNDVPVSTTKVYYQAATPTMNNGDIWFKII